MIENERPVQCPQCGLTADDAGEVKRMFGLRHGKRQSWCKECRRKAQKTIPRKIFIEPPHLQRRGIERPGVIGWVHAEVCWCQEMPADAEAWVANKDMSFRWGFE